MIESAEVFFQENNLSVAMPPEICHFLHFQPGSSWRSYILLSHAQASQSLSYACISYPKMTHISHRSITHRHRPLSSDLAIQAVTRSGQQSDRVFHKSSYTYSSYKSSHRHVLAPITTPATFLDSKFFNFQSPVLSHPKKLFSGFTRSDFGMEQHTRCWCRRCRLSRAN